tara:strand:+ start:426 stop:578 length:153 start_codon:yes stop_codon:yes gene_type:complete
MKYITIKVSEDNLYKVVEVWGDYLHYDDTTTRDVVTTTVDELIDILNDLK